MANTSGSGIIGWPLERITAPSGETVDFEYEYFTYETPWIDSYTYIYAWPNQRTDVLDPDPHMYTSGSSSTLDKLLIKKIRTKFQEAIFDYENDASLSIIKKRLKKITIVDISTKDTVVLVSFQKGVFNNDSRLRLDGVN